MLGVPVLPLELASDSSRRDELPIVLLQIATVTLDDLDLCKSRRETWGERSLVEAWFGLFKYRTRLFYSRFPHYSSWKSVDRWAKAFAAIHNAITQP